MNKIKKVAILISIPTFINIAVTIFCYLQIGKSEFLGYLTGTILSLIFAIIWIWMAKKFSSSNILVIIAISLGTLPVKLIIFAILAFGGVYYFNISKIYFAISFLFGVLASLIFELWYVLSVNKEIANQKNTI